MRTIHYHAKYIKRSLGNSVIGFAAYCTGQRLRSQYDGRTHYKSRSDVVYNRIILPPNAPEDYRDREALWNAVEMSEGSNAQLARAIDLDFPAELSRKTQIDMLLNYVQRVFVDHGMCADLAIHDRGNGNPHAHIILTLRGIDEKGNWTGKWKKNYLLDNHGNRIRDPVSNRYMCGPSIPLNDWGNRENIETWRREWADACNRELARIGSDTRMTHKSYIRQDVYRTPQIHLGRKVCALEKRGVRTDRGRQNREIIERNRQHDEREREERSRGWEINRSR